MNRGPFLQCRDFSFFYGHNRVLDGIGFNLEKGQWLSILGPNGSGKSTLLKNLLHLARGSACGEILLANRPVNGRSQIELARQLAYVPQAAAIPPFRVREFVELSRFPWKRARPEDQNERTPWDALNLTHTEHLADRRMDQLSGGQRQRVLLAAALAQQTGTLLLDEPTAFLDPRHAREMIDLLQSLHAENGLGIIIVTHDLSLPFDVGGMVLALSAGRQTYFGPADALRENGVLDASFDYSFSYLIHPRTGKTLVAV